LILAGLAGALAILVQAAGGVPLVATFPTTIVILLGWAIARALRRAGSESTLASAR
jgi:hypothetical protein